MPTHRPNPDDDIVERLARILEDPKFKAEPPEVQEGILQNVRPAEPGFYAGLIAQSATPLKQYSDDGSKIPLIGRAAVELGIGAASMFPQTKIPAAALKIGVPIAQAVGGIGYDYMTNPDFDSRTILPNLGAAAGQAFSSPTAGIARQGLNSGIGAFLGTGGNVAAGLEDVDPTKAGLAAGIPASLGAAFAGAGKGVNYAAGFIPGMGSIQAEVGKKLSRKMVESHKPKADSKSLYDALAEQGENVQISNEASLKLQADIRKSADDLDQLYPGWKDSSVTRTSGQAILTRAKTAIETAKRRQISSGIKVEEARLSADKLQDALNDIQSNPKSTPKQIDYAERALLNKQNRLKEALDDVEYQGSSIGRAQARQNEVLTVQSGPLPIHQQHLRELNASLEGTEGIARGSISQEIKATWENMQNAATTPALKKANETFRREVVLENLHDMITKSSSEEYGMEVINAKLMSTKLTRAIEGDEFSRQSGETMDFFKGAFDPKEIEQIRGFFKQLDKTITKRGGFSLRIVSSGIGAAAGATLGTAMGFTPSTGAGMGAAAGFAAPEEVLKLAVSSKAMRDFFFKLTQAGNGSITRPALSTLVQIAEQENARRGPNHIEFEVEEPEEEDGLSSLLNSLQQAGAQ